MRRFFVIGEMRGGGSYYDGPFTFEEAKADAYNVRWRDDRARIWEYDGGVWYMCSEINPNRRTISDVENGSYYTPTPWWIPDLNSKPKLFQH